MGTDSKIASDKDDFHRKCSEKLNHNALRGFGIASAPAAWASPHIAITSHKVNQIAEGSQGETPLELPPLLGERGGHLRIFKVNEKMNKIRFSTESKIAYRDSQGYPVLKCMV